MRLARYLAHSGVASRRKAEEVIRAGRVSVAGDVVLDPARDVDESSDVRVDGVLVARTAGVWMMGTVVVEMAGVVGLQAGQSWRWFMSWRHIRARHPLLKQLGWA